MVTVIVGGHIAVSHDILILLIILYNLAFSQRVFHIHSHHLGHRGVSLDILILLMILYNLAFSQRVFMVTVIIGVTYG